MIAMLVYVVRLWEGEYYTRDASSGVETAPVQSRLWRIQADGSGRMPLTGGEGRDEHPLVTSDGRWIYYQTNPGNRWQIRRMRTDGTGNVLVAPADAAHHAYGAVLARAGGYFTWTRQAGREGAVVLSAADGSELRPIAPDWGYVYMAAPDATGQQVVFSGPARGYRLGLARAPDWAPVLLTPDHPDSYVPQFTPDGRTVVFIRRDGGLYRIESDGTRLQRLADGVQVEFFLSPADKHGSTDGPAISPDGTRIAFVRSERNRPPQIAVVGIDGSDLRVLTDLPGTCGRVQWSPDGRWLAFVSFVGQWPQLWVMPADGTAPPRQITQENGAVYALSWIPAA